MIAAVSCRTDADGLLAERNTKSKEIGQLFKEGKADEASVLREQVTQIKEKLEGLTAEQEEVRNALREMLVSIPNVPHDLVPAGTNEEDNEDIPGVAGRIACR